MKQATVKYFGSNDVSIGTLIESMEDINNMKSVVSNAETSTITKFIKSNEPAYRYNHVIGGLRPIEKALGSLAVSRAMIKGDNPIYHMGECKNLYLIGLVALLTSGNKIFINSNGGYCPVEGTMEIISVEEVEYVTNVKPYISKNTKVINLENDFEIEREAENYMKNVLKDYNYSFITELRLYTKDKLKKTFKDFIEKGGNTVYVYTTGRDVEQMYEYSECAISAGLNKFIFKFNAGTDDDINKFIIWLSKRVNVTCVK
jgi:hypothetical protein